MTLSVAARPELDRTTRRPRFPRAEEIVMSPKIKIYGYFSTSAETVYVALTCAGTRPSCAVAFRRQYTFRFGECAELHPSRKF